VWSGCLVVSRGGGGAPLSEAFLVPPALGSASATDGAVYESRLSASSLRPPQERSTARTVAQRRNTGRGKLAAFVGFGITGCAA
jgi:hypothetical protein